MHAALTFTVYDQLRDFSHNASNWETFHINIKKYELYSKDNSGIKGVLHDMAIQKIVHIVQKEGGTQLKLIIEFAGEGKALFKPMR
uniref:Uncharacterized protein n=1 Tax=Strigamia maritima TaxID=126957 RepID=T1JI12_STRMM